MPDKIRSGRCPYCGGVYAVAYGGCANNCPEMQQHARLVRQAADAGVTELDEIEQRAAHWQDTRPYGAAHRLQPQALTVNGKEQGWTEEIWKLWYTYADEADPKWANVWVSRANYFTPRPYVDEYNRGTHNAGFVYILQPGNRVCLVEWHQEPPTTRSVPHGPTDPR